MRSFTVNTVALEIITKPKKLGEIQAATHVAMIRTLTANRKPMRAEKITLSIAYPLRVKSCGLFLGFFLKMPRNFERIALINFNIMQGPS